MRTKLSHSARNLVQSVSRFLPLLGMVFLMGAEDDCIIRIIQGDEGPDDEAEVDPGDPPPDGECLAVDCALNCDRGFAADERGCPVCACADGTEGCSDAEPPPPPPCEGELFFDPSRCVWTCNGVPVGDRDGDGVPDDRDPLPDDYCVPRAELCGEVPNDSDGDGMPDDIDPAPGDPCAPFAALPECQVFDRDGDQLADDFDVAPDDPCAPLVVDSRICDPSLDGDHDGLNDQYDPDPNNPDVDGDGVPDGFDLSPVDGCVPDRNSPACQANPPGGDRDGDGVPDAEDPAPNDRCVPYRELCGAPDRDRDGDGLPDSQDPAPDDYCQPYFDLCGGGDRDGDGLPDAQDPAPDDYCQPYFDLCGGGDRDGDGVPDAQDPAPDDRCQPYASLCGGGDRDGDGLPDQFDPDPGNPDTDGDGCLDGSDPAPLDPTLGCTVVADCREVNDPCATDSDCCSRFCAADGFCS